MIIPVYNVTVVPGATLYFQTERIRELGRMDPNKGEDVIFLIEKTEKPREELTDEDFYPIGVTGKVTEIHDEGYTEISTISRVSIDDVIVNADKSFNISITKLNDIDDYDPKEKEDHLNHLKEAIVEYISKFQWGPSMTVFIRGFDSVEQIAAAMSPWMNASPEDRYAALSTPSKKERAGLLEKMLYEFVEIARITTDAESEQQEDYRKVYREQAIKKQIDYLQKELDEMHPENVSDLRKMEMKIDKSGMNETAMSECKKILSRLKQEGENGNDFGMLFDYLDFMTTLSWKKQPFRKIDLKKAEKILDRDHFGLKKVKKRIIQQIAVMNLRQQQSGSILLFVGPPGTGKTSIGISIAEALHRKYVRVSLGGVRDEADIRGHRRTYIGAMPGRIMDGIAKSGSSNPVVVLDEVDKLSSSYNGDPASALLEVLDPEQNSTFTDHYMNVPYDLSDVFFVCTANSEENIPAPLLNRMEVIRFQGYTSDEKLEIAKKHLLPKAMESMGIGKSDISIGDSVMKTIISEYTAEAGVRGLKKRLDTLCRTAAVKINEERENNPDKKDDRRRGRRKAIVSVHEADLHEYLDMQPLIHDRTLRSAKPGIVTGLAWTEAGGEILFIETMAVKGTGQVQITGQLGDVMKESVEIAVSLVRSMYPGKADWFKKHDIHIHVPEGAVPKDGPSAGITMTTALSSLVSGHPVDTKTAMTGEVSLRGAVLPIGGLPEKLMAAVRAGVKTVYIPADNERDLSDVPDEARNSLEIIPVKTVSDVLKAVGIR